MARSMTVALIIHDPRSFLSSFIVYLLFRYKKSLFPAAAGPPLSLFELLHQWFDLGQHVVYVFKHNALGGPEIIRL